jgi:glucosamine--fructose-6-phosphate aminotransferase (isomerizing)
MCGIVAVLRRPTDRRPPELAGLADLIAAAGSDLDRGIADATTRRHDFEAAAGHLGTVDAALRGSAGVRALLADPAGAAGLATALDALDGAVRRFDERLDAEVGAAPVVDEPLNRALALGRDRVWALGRVRVRTAAAVAALAGDARTIAAIDGYLSIQIALSAIDRLEVRGRDSAGLEVVVRGHALDAEDVAARVGSRADALHRSRAVRAVDDALCFVYKAAAEIGELGDNVAALRATIARDDLLRAALADDAARVLVLGHTRWASVGIISEANAHPLDQEELDRFGAVYAAAALNGDVDNYAELVGLHQLQIAPEITTDAKVIPAIMARAVEAGASPDEAFRDAVASFEGSVAIGAHTSAAPDRAFFALRGSGQGLYVGVAEDAFVVASEPYGLVEETHTYLRLDGETPANPDNPGGSRGQLVVLDATRAGTLDGITRVAYDGTPLPVTNADLVEAEITTRDIDRGDFPHYLLKEITEAPDSFRTTLRGKLVERDGMLHVALPDSTIPTELRAQLAAGEIRRVVVVGQGTAAVAGQSLAVALTAALGAGHPLRVEAMLATELSGFGLVDDMSDALVVAISQSGTTTDTNTTVDLARARGASVIAIVNRRNSDLVDRSDGVLYTSDGRDVEMSVASTKAFYAQVAAGFLLATALAEAIGVVADDDLRLRGLHDLPDAMRAVLDQRDVIGAAAHAHAPFRRYWAVVGNGPNRIAAHEVRIKLSELCYKSIACDGTEDKKHIDLSSEPMILVCAAGLSGSNADDVAKELAIYRAHKAAAIAIVSEDDDRYRAAVEVIRVPRVHPSFGFVLSAMAGHLFGYEAALAIDASARPLREARAALEATPVTTELGPLTERIAESAAQFFTGVRTGLYDGALEAATAVRLASVLRYAAGIVPLDVYSAEHGTLGTPAVVAAERLVLVTRGRVDDRIVAIVPEVKGAQTVGLTLLHLELPDRLPADVARGVLSGYRHRYTALRGAITETEPELDDARLADVPVVDLLTLPIASLADRWRQ